MLHIIVAASASPSTVQDDPVWSTLIDATDQPYHAYSWLVAELFDPSTAEGALAAYLARHADYDFEQSLAFISAQAETIGSEIVSHGWNAIVSNINGEMLEALDDPDVRRRLKDALHLSAPYTELERLREHIEARTFTGTGWITTAAYAERGLPEAEMAALKRSQEKWDFSRTPEDRERVAREIFDLIGNRIKEMFTRTPLGKRLTPDQAESLAWQALHRGLELSGVSRFIRMNASSGDWASVIQKCRPGQGTQTASGARIWSMLSPAFKATLANRPPLQASTRVLDEAFVRELNAVLRRRDLYDSAAWSGVKIPDEAQALIEKGVDKLPMTDLSRLNLLLVASAFSGLSVPAKPQNLLLGYVHQISQHMKRDVYEAATGQSWDSTAMDTYGFLREDIEAVQRGRSSGELDTATPLAEQIYNHQRERLNRRYAKVIEWWNSMIARLQPSNPFRLTNAHSLQTAKELLEANKSRVPENLWKFPNSPNYLPTRALHIYGLGSIQRMLSTLNIGVAAPVPAKQQAAPVATQAPQALAEDAAMQWLRGGHASKAYSFLVNRLFEPGSVEFLIGHFLTQNPMPTRPMVTDWIQSQSEQIEEEVQYAGGWDRLVREIDVKVLAAVKDKGTIAELQEALGTPQAIQAAVAVRWAIFGRLTALVNRINKVA